MEKELTKKFMEDAIASSISLLADLKNSNFGTAKEKAENLINLLKRLDKRI